MKKPAAAIVTAVLALSLSLAGLAATATAAPEPSPSASPSDVAAGCVNSPTFAYTYDRATSAGTITVTKVSAAAGTALCRALSVRSVSWAYDLPVTATNPSYPQSFDAKQDVSVTALGVFTFQAPNASSGCRQHDIYASFSGFTALALPTALTGPTKPFEPTLLSAVLAGKGPGPTYGHDLSAGCGSAIEPTVSPQVCNPDLENAVLSGSISTPLIAGVRYTIHPVSPSGRDIVATGATTDVMPGIYSVTATSLSSQSLAGTTTWTKTVLDESVGCDLTTHAFLPASAIPTGESCSNGSTVSGYITIDPTDRVAYAVNGVRLTSARTAFASGVYVVNATAVSPDDVVEAPADITVTITPTATSCSVAGVSAVGDGAIASGAVANGAIADTDAFRAAADLASTGSADSDLVLGIAGVLILAGIVLVTSAVISSRRLADPKVHDRSS